MELSGSPEILTTEMVQECLSLGPLAIPSLLGENKTNIKI